MKVVPLIFAIDRNVIVQMEVTITSLLANAALDTFYEVNVLCEELAMPEGFKTEVADLFSKDGHCSISFVDVGTVFSDSALNTNGHITKATYYRLLIPSLFPQYEKVIYSDVDIIYQNDLSEVFLQSCNNGELVAAALDLSIDNSFFFDSPLPELIGCSTKTYFNAGFLVMNLSAMRSENVEKQFDSVMCSVTCAENDQDVLNIVCKGRIQYLPTRYNFQPNHYSNYMWNRDSSDIDFRSLFKDATIHYTGPNKPWNSLECVSSDAWWHYYRQTPSFDNLTYFKRQQESIENNRNDYHIVKTRTLIIQLLGRVRKKLFTLCQK